MSTVAPFRPDGIRFFSSLEVEQELQALENGLHSLSLGQTQEREDIKQWGNSLRRAQENDCALNTKRRQLIDLETEVSHIEAKSASKILTISSQIAKLKLDIERMTRENSRHLQTLTSKKDLDAERTFQVITSEIQPGIEKLDTWLFQPSEQAIVKAAKTIIKVYEKNKNISDNTKGYLLDAISYLQGKIGAKKIITGSKLDKKSVRLDHIRIDLQPQKFLPATHSSQIITGHAPISVTTSYPKTKTFTEQNLSTVEHHIQEIRARLQKHFEDIIQAKELTDLAQLLTSYERQLDELKNCIDYNLDQIKTLDAPHLFVRFRHAILFCQSETVAELLNECALLKEFTQESLQLLAQANTEATRFFEYLEQTKRSPKTAEDEYRLSMRCFKACSALMPALLFCSQKKASFADTYIQDRLGVIIQAVRAHVSDVFTLTDTEKHLVAHVFQNASVDRYTVNAYLLKSIGAYRFCRCETELPDPLVEVIFYLQSSVVEQEVRDQITHYFTSINSYKIDSDTHIKELITVLQFIYTQLVGKNDRDPLKFLHGWHHYFTLAEKIGEPSDAMKLVFPKIAEILNTIAESNGYFIIEKNQLEARQEDLTLLGFVSSLAKAIYEDDQSKLDAANNFLNTFMQSSTFSRQIETFEEDARTLISENLMRKIAKRSFDLIIAEECESAIKHGFIKEVLDSNGASTHLGEIIALLMYVEKISLTQTLASQQTVKTPVLTAIIARKMEKYIMQFMSIWPEQKSGSQNLLRALTSAASS